MNMLLKNLHLVFWKIEYGGLLDLKNKHLRPRRGIENLTLANSNFSRIYHDTSTVHPQAIDFCDNQLLQTSTKSIFYVLFMVFLLVSSILGNVLVVLATSLSGKLRRRPTNYFIVSLAFSDVLMAMVAIPFNISTQLHQFLFCHSISACYWWLLGESTSTVASILNLFFIALDRFVAIRYPYKYREMFSYRRVRWMLFCLWSFALVYPITGILPWSNIPSQKGSHFTISNVNYVCANYNRSFFAVSFLGIYIIPLVVMSFTYCMILQIALTQIRAIQRTQVSLRSVDPQQSTRSDDSSMTTNNTSSRRRKELHATKSVAIVYSAFLICWFPVCVVNIILLFDVGYFPRLLMSNKTMFLFVWYGLIQILPMINTMVNPIIYSFSNKQFRNGFRSVYQRLKGETRFTEYTNPDFRDISRRRTIRKSQPEMSQDDISLNSSNSENCFQQQPVTFEVEFNQHCCLDGDIRMISDKIIWKPD
ncbi:adenosine receptor A2b-like [Clytia hemisphaerica]|uniref:adenosine receptor A2b-like n=1 Tax=Clytia hemisphaerica TaxID=252671 RepID=UPI0034D59AB1